MMRVQGCISLCLLASSVHAASFGDVEVPRKHVMFMTGLGTPSHFMPMGEIGKELERRGHLFTWAGFDEAQHAWDKNKLDMPFVVMGSNMLARADELMIDALSEAAPGVLTLAGRFASLVPPVYKAQYHATVAAIQGNLTARYLNGSEIRIPPPDLLVCDNAAFTCADVAYERNIPYMITTQGFYMGVGKVPYLLDGMEGDPEVSNSLRRRLWNVVLPVVSMYAFRPLITSTARTRQELGAPAINGVSFMRWRGVSILNTGSFFGWDEPRELGPFSHMVGPIVTDRVRNPEPLQEPLKSWMDAAAPSADGSGDGKGIVLVALGSVAKLSAERGARIFKALRELKEEGVISGAIIANRAKCPFTPEELEAANVRYESWVPQTSVLAHPATKAFIAHGGIESMYEAMYYATPVLVIPNHGDQYANGHKAQAAGIGFTISKHSPAEVIKEKLAAVVRDETGSIRKASERLRVLFQFAARDKVAKGADLVETELLVGHSHLVTFPERVGFFRAYNVDLYLLLSVVLIAFLIALRRIVRGLWAVASKVSTRRLTKGLKGQ